MSSEDQKEEEQTMLEKTSNNNGDDSRLNTEIPTDQTSLTHDLDTYRHRSECNGNSIEKDTDTICGLGPCTPTWMQKFASKQTFLIVFCIAWVLQGMYHTYFVSAITTIEKLFQIQSKVTGIIMSATEIGQIGSSLLLTYYGGQGHRPKWIAWGMVLFAVSSFTCSLPHFIYGRQLITANDLTGITKEPNVCRAFTSNASLLMSFNNLSSVDNFTTSLPHIMQSCEEEITMGHRLQPSVTNIVLAIFFISLLGVGMGQTAVYTLGIPYIDDNVASKESPLYFAITIGVRILGPALGFIVGSLCTSVYADLSVDPKIDSTDPRWNDILMFRTASSVLHILPIAGLYTFLPKYLETQFRLPTPSANMISGVGGILVMGLGIIISGVFILRVKPNARFVAAWIAFTAVVYAIGKFDAQLLNCNETYCNCNKDKFAPICGQDGKTYLSPCHAGCQNYVEKDGKIIHYSECMCLNFTANSTLNDQMTYGNATIGYCDLQCPNFILYIVLFSIFVFIHSTSEVGSMLLILRCVDPRDKAMALGLIQFAIGLFGNVPCPIVYGAVVDSACLVWKMACGEKGACGLYDSDVFRMYHRGDSIMCVFVDVIVWYKAGSINFVDEQVPFEAELNQLTSKIKNEGE
nr:unnamed protein product [Callosobruchus chinensis]